MKSYKSNRRINSSEASRKVEAFSLTHSFLGNLGNYSYQTTDNKHHPDKMDPLSESASVQHTKTENEHALLGAQLPSELQQHVTAFLRDLKRPKYSKPLSYEELCVLFQEFYRAMRERSREYLWGSVQVRRVEMKDLSADGGGGPGSPQRKDGEQQHDDQAQEELVRKYVDIAEFKVTSSLGDRLMFKSDSNCQVNDLIKKKIQVINKIEDLDYYKLLDLSPDVVDLDLPVFKTISAEFEVLQGYKTPFQKLTKLISIHFSLIDVLRSDVNGDYILPLLIYLILVNDVESDLFLNFMFIKNFRNIDHFQGDELYCLTNFEAALTYIQTLDLKDFKFKDLTPEQEILVQKSDLMQITPEKYTVPFNFVTSAIDSSFKTVLSRLRPESPLSSEPLVNNTDFPANANPIKNFMGDVMKWTSRSPVPTTALETTSGRVRSGSGSSFMNKLKNVGNSKQIMSEEVEAGSTATINLKKFKGKTFEDMSITELREMFHNYQILASQVQR